MAEGAINKVELHEFLLQIENSQDFISKNTKGGQKRDRGSVTENTDGYAKAVFKRSKIQIYE